MKTEIKAQHVHLGDVCEVLNGYAFKSNRYVSTGIRVIRITNVQKGYIEDNAPQFYPVECEQEIKKYLLYENDLLMSLTGNVGRVALLKKEMLPAALNQRVACLRLKNTAIIYKPYLFHFLNSDIFENLCVFSAQGIAQKNMSTEWLKECKIPMYPIKEQQKIADVLDGVSSLIDKRKRQLALLDELVKSRFVELFGTYPANEKKWTVKTIRSVVSDVRYGSSRPAVENGQYPYLRMNNITYGGELDLSNIKRIDIPETELEKCIVKRGDVLFNRTNSKELVGKTCVYNRDELMVLAGFIIRVRVNDSILPEFLSAFLNADFSKKMLLGMAKTAIGQANINAQELQNIKLYIPPMKLQQQFADFVSRVDGVKVSVKNSLQELETLKGALLQRYFS